MEKLNLEALRQFDEANLPDLDVVVLGALELFSEIELPTINVSHCAHPIVLGSGNAEVTGRILFRDQDALYEDESSYRAKLDSARAGIENAIIISASGSKHAVEMARDLKERGLTVWLYTNNPEAPATEFVDLEHIKVFPRNREPYTYNTSTYMSMIMGKTGESPEMIHQFIHEHVAPVVPDNLASYDSFYFIIPPHLSGVREMLLTKFDELFGPRVSGRVFTFEQTKHAKTVVPSESELFVSFGEENNLFGKPEQRLHIPLPEQVGPAAMMAIGYWFVGQIQKQHPPYFKERIAAYMQEATELFGQELKPIVE
ncbi:MAG: hypothetical protein AAGA35_00530 [Patescibacteria group bacterium]